MDGKLANKTPLAPYEPSRKLMTVRIIIDIWIIFASSVVAIIAVLHISLNEFTGFLFVATYGIIIIGIKILAAKSGSFRFYVNAASYILIIVFLLYAIKVESISNQSKFLHYYIDAMSIIGLLLCLFKILILYTLRKKEV